MKLYLSNLLPRLQEYSLSLDKKEVFVEKPWVIVDENLNQQKYIFRRDGELIMSLNGTVKIGSWEYIAAAKSLLINRIQDKILLNQFFIDPAVMVLKKDGFKDENLIMANEILIPDLDVTTYLKKIYYQKNNIVIKQLKNGQLLEFAKISESSSMDNLLKVTDAKVTMDGETVPDGEYELDSSKFLIQNGKVIKVINHYKYPTSKGSISIYQEYSHPIVGERVFQNEKPAPDGKYRIDIFHYITVHNGIISKISLF